MTPLLAFILAIVVPAAWGWAVNRTFDRLKIAERLRIGGDSENGDWDYQI